MADSDLSSSEAERKLLSSSKTSCNLKAPKSCPECTKTFTRSDNLRRHVEKIHPIKLNEFLALTSKKYKYKCSDCHRQYNDIQNLKTHERIMHMKLVRTAKLYKCPLCDKEFEMVSKINAHLKKEHDLALKIETYTFSTYDEFSKWKSNLENDTKCYFTKKNSSYHGNSKDERYSYFQCHRSGCYNPRGNGMRRLKASGSNKINAYCPARIKLYEKKDEFVVTFQSTHLGHENEFAHWKFIKGKFTTESGFEPVLYDVRSSLSTPSSLKLHMLTKQDVFHVENSFVISLDEMGYLSDPAYADKWIDEITLNGASCILLYKAQGTTLLNYPDLNSDDFVVIIMNEVQAELLKVFGPDCVCIDSSYGKKALDFQLTKLLVLNNFQQCLPCAFMISNRADRAIMELFFSELKKVTGQLKSKIFVSAVPNFYHSAWCSVMGKVETRYYGSWHVDRIWRKKLNSLVKNKESRFEIYRLLRTLLEERDKTTFEDLLQNVIQHLKDKEEFRQFGTYFVEIYSKNVKYWAYSHRTPKDIDCDMSVEKMHKTFNCMYNKCRNVESVEKIIHAFMKFLRDKIFDKIVVLSRETTLQNLKVIEQRHTISKATEAVISKTDEKQWLVSSSNDDDEIYVIKENKRECECQLICLPCNTCIHKYVCTCPDSAVKWNMCKHAHSLCTIVNSTMTNNEDDRDCSMSAAVVNNQDKSGCCVSATIVNNENNRDCSIDTVIKNNEDNNGCYEDNGIKTSFSDDAHSDKLKESQKEHPSSQVITAKRKNNLKRKIISIINSVDLLSAEDFELVEHIISSYPSKKTALQKNS